MSHSRSWQVAALRMLVGLALMLAVACGGQPQPVATDPIPATPSVTALPTMAPPPPAGADDTATPGAGSPLEPSEPFGRADITLVGPGGERIRMPVYVAATGEARSRGLMFRRELPPGTGMLFLFPQPTSVGFYMKNTVMPLSIAWYSDDGTILAIRDMEPCPSDPCPTYSPDATYVGAVEVPQGVFADLGVEEGWTVELPADLPTPS